jgi:hypothetical protein
MDPVTVILVPGFLGGLVIALLLMKLQRRSHSCVLDDEARDEKLSSDAINRAHIRVAGVGGLGLVAMAIVVALTLPSIGWSMALGLVLGVLFAVVLILLRRRQGPMPSSGRHAGANTSLSIERPLLSAEEDVHNSNVHVEDVSVVPVTAF